MLRLLDEPAAPDTDATEKMIRDDLQFVADRIAAILDGTLVGPRHAAMAGIADAVSRVCTVMPDDRSFQ
mgnify:CR=1 FL=1